MQIIGFDYNDCSNYYINDDIVFKVICIYLVQKSD